ncbi:hypothetical protein [Metabacillus niabensis]|uniref:Uncharacterized protein n=1 Tax=Metabacillus niabensis TaxID=324854 RepID=A0ABT9YW81_9BACI|nr:hypothetical protein [Metabacillus niabensis]MDQ0223852.1 hypothetical protein [Metabacillus niabensis]
MPNRSNQNDTQKNALKNSQQSGSNYHKQHAGNVEGYGEPYPTATNTSDTSETTK